MTLDAMKISRSLFVWAGFALLASAGAPMSLAQNTTNFPTLGTVVRLSSELDAVLDRELDPG